MLRDSINNAIQTLLEGHEVQVSLDLIRDGLSAGVFCSMDVEEFLRDIAFDYEEYHEQVIDIMNTYGIEVPFGIKSKHLVSDIQKRLENLLFFIESDDARNSAKTNINGIIYDLDEHLSELIEELE